MLYNNHRGYDQLEAITGTKKLFFSEEMEVDEGGGDEELQSTQGINTIDSQSIMNQKVSQSISVSVNLSIDC